jgi:tetratricopeptide (TPR) repeat protein
MRHRNHIIEDESRNHFNLIIPKIWVCRDKRDSDYGIDCEVEIFNESNESCVPTGQVFWVQLKATDSIDKSVIQSISLPIKKLQQLKRYSIPVMIIRYSTQEKSFYYKWCSDIDLYFSIIENNINHKVKFTESDKWETSQTPLKILEYLNRISKIGFIQLPIKTYFSSTNLQIQGLTNRILDSQIRTKLNNKYIKFITYEEQSDNADCIVVLSNDNIAVNFCEAKHIVLHQPKYDDIDFLVKYILIGVASCLDEVGRIESCNKILFKAELFDLLSKRRSLLNPLIPSLLTGEYFEKSFEKLSEILEDTELENTVDGITTRFLIEVSLLNYRKSTSKRIKSNVIENFYLKDIDDLCKTENYSSAGVSSYNLANYYRSQSKFNLAFIYYLKAKRFTPEYLNCDYFYRELAGILHELGKYYFASKFYKKALELNPDSSEIKALYADSLMYSGYYEKAKILFDEYLSDSYYAREASNESEHFNDNYNDWCHLKYSCLETLLQAGYPSSQKRNKNKAEELADVKELDYEEAKRRLDEALQNDLLCSLAWFNLGYSFSLGRDDLNSMISFTMCALIQPKDVEAWVNSCFSAFNLQSNLFYYIVRVAYFYTGEKFIQGLASQLQANPNNINSKMLDDFLAIIDTIRPKEQNSEQSILRILGEGSKFEEIKIVTK